MTAVDPDWGDTVLAVHDHEQRSRSERIVGRVQIARSALINVAKASAADILRVPSSMVQVKIGDSSGLIAIALVAPVRIEMSGARDRTPADGGLIDTMNRARVSIADRVSALTGRQVGRVDLELSSAWFSTRTRVR